jgi:hypothetical protein
MGHVLQKLGAKRTQPPLTIQSKRGDFAGSGWPRPALSPPRPDLLSILAHESPPPVRADADAASLVDIGNAPNDILDGQYAAIARHLDTQLREPRNYRR